jgi:hypothetical protein
MKKIKLEELKNLARVIAEAKIKQDGVYYCVIGGQKVEVTA